MGGLVIGSDGKAYDLIKLLKNITNGEISYDLEERLSLIEDDLDIIKAAIGNGNYEIMSYINVVAPPPESNKKFAYWIDQDNNILCYTPLYGFYSIRDVQLTPVYVDESVEVERKGNSMVTVVSPLDKKIIFIVERCIPPENSIVTHGLIVTNNASIGTNENAFVIGGSGVLKAESSTKSGVGIYKVTKTANSGETWYARGFITHQDSNNNIETVYSSIVSGTAL